MSDGLQSFSSGLSASIKSIVSKSGISNVTFSVEGAVPKGQNYTGVIYRLTLTGKKGNRDVILTYIVKVALHNENIRTELPLSTAYQREAMYYTELFPIYQRMQDEVGIPFEDQFRFTECYGTGNEYLNEFLIFKDLKPFGYVTLNRKDELDYEHARYALEAYGKLHALSFALKKKDPKKFEYFVQNVSEIMIVKNGSFINLVKSALEKVIVLMENTQYGEVLEDLKDNIDDRLLDMLTQDEFSVLSHSDCWSGNMMFRYEDGKPVETCLLDFQIGRYGAPAIDVMYFIFTNTGGKLRAEHYEDLLFVYHNAMKNHLKTLSYDIELIYPWTRFKQDLVKTSLLGLAAGISIPLVMLSDEELIPDISDFVDFRNSDLFKSKSSDIYVERVKDIVKDFVNYGYLS